MDLKRVTCSFTMLGVVILLIIIPGQRAEAQGSLTYTNERYGFQLSYPSFLVSAPKPAKGDGVRMYDKKGFVMVASGINNTSGETFQSELNTQWENIGKISYGVRGNNWFAISGSKGDKIIYVKSYIGTGAINHLYIEYPVEQKEKYDKVVEAIAKSFTPGDLSKGH